MLYSIAGLVLSLFVAGAAWCRSRSAGGYYEREVYGMQRTTHLRYGAISLVFAALFAVFVALHSKAAGIAALALYALIAVFYAASFLRGAAGPDE